ncbi:MAG TPA: alpha/beta fold hydrolase [Gemmatimonadaceae bacterium]|nr:alpha/beta fold hydrolase [Gemmatimonadaceae bacterium]
MISARMALAAAAIAVSAAPVETQQPRHTYVIVHGAWGGGWDWKQVDSTLTTAAHKVYRPTLTGLGERVHLLTPSVDLSTHIMDIVNVIRYENLRDVVLVGHSYGGMVISGVADRIPDRIRRLVYVDAVVPEDGESLLTAAGGALLDSAGRAWIDSAKDVIVPGWVKPGASPPTDVPHPKRTFTEPIKLQNPAGRRIPATYILTVESGKAEADDGFAAFAQRAKSRGWTYHVLRSDHTPERSAVAELTDLLRRVP